MSLDEVFMDTVKGKISELKNLSSAGSWTPADGVPRPDVKYDTLFWMSALGGFLGLDHLYMRSPVTAFLKILSLVVLPGVWWLWDILQLSTEKERVLNYGMSSPFDIFTGIAQGMITDKPSQYTTGGYFGVWIFAKLFGFLGFSDMAGGRPWLGLRKMIIFLLTSATFTWAMQGSWGWWLIFPFPFFLCLGIFDVWFMDLYYLFSDPQQIFITGLPMHDFAYNQFAWPNSLYKDENGKLTEAAVVRQLNQDYIPSQCGTSVDEINRLFRIRHNQEPLPVKAKDTTDPKDKVSIPPFTVILKVFKVIWAWIQRTCQAIIKEILANTPAGRAAAAAAAAEGAGKIPGMPGAGGLGAIPSAGLSVPTGLGAPTGAAAATVTTPAPGGSPTIAPGANSSATGGAMRGGAASDELSLESQLMGAAVAALIAGGSIKGLVDYLLAN